jgi:hypothetical protein
MAAMATRNTRSRTSLIALALGFACALAPVRAALAEGFYFEAHTTDQIEGGKERSHSVVHGWVDGAAAKVEFQDQKGTMFKPGSYLLTKDGGKTLYLVDPKEKAYAKWDLDAMLATTFALLESTGPLMNIEFSNAASKKLGEDDGGSVLGHPTRHYQWQSAYDMKMSIIGIKRQYHVDQLQDFWSTDQLGADGFKVWLRPDRNRTGNAGFDQMLAAEMAKVKGFPLKSVTKSKMTTGKGKEQNSILTMEVTTLRKEPVAASTFEVPAGYEERPFVPGMQPEDKKEKK